MRKTILTSMFAAAISVALAGCNHQGVEESPKSLLKEDVHYKIIENSIPSKENEIIEFFWFRCGHCYSFDEYLMANESKLLDSGMTLRKEHAAVSVNWVKDARIFYAFRSLGLEKESVPLMMKSIHRPEAKKPFDVIVEELGITKDQFTQAYNSAEVKKELENSIEWALDSGVTGVPALIVEGKYLMILQGFKGYDEMVDGAISLAKEHSVADTLKAESTKN